MGRWVLLLISACLWAGPPAVDDLLNLKQAGGAAISPDGRLVAYGVGEADWDQDAFVRQIWLAGVETGRTRQMTRGKKSAGAPKWSPDGQWLAFTSDREGGKNQVFVIPAEGGEALQLTKSETGAGSFDWSPDGKKIAYTATEKRPEDRKNHYGDFEVVRRDYAHIHLWIFDVEEAMKAPVIGEQATKGKDFSVGGFAWSPDAKRIAFSAAINPDLVQGGTSDIYVLALGDGAVRKIVSQPGPDSGSRWSPDGQWIVFRSAMGQEKYYHSVSRLAVVAAEGGPVRSITDSFNEQPMLVDWTPAGVYFLGLQKMEMHLFLADPVKGVVTRISDTPAGWGLSLTKDGKRAAFTVENGQQLAEVYVTDLTPWSPEEIDRHDRASARLDAAGERGDLLEEQRRRRDRGCADQARGL